MDRIEPLYEDINQNITLKHHEEIPTKRCNCDMLGSQTVTQIYIIYLSYKVMIDPTYFCNGNTRLQYVILLQI